MLLVQQSFHRRVVEIGDTLSLEEHNLSRMKEKKKIRESSVPNNPRACALLVSSSCLAVLPLVDLE